MYPKKLPITPFIIILVGILLSVIWIFIFNTLDNVNRSETESAENNLQNITRSFKTHTESTILNADQILKIIKINYERSGEESFTFLKSFFPNSENVQQFFNQIGIIDKDGIYVFSSLPSFKRVDLSDREHYKIHLSIYEPGIFISKPVLGRVSQKWSIQLTRRLENSHGEFNGVAVISIDPIYLIKFYKKINLGNKGLVALVDNEGNVRTLSSGDFTSFDGTVPKLNVPIELMNGTNGVFKSNKILDGELRLFSYEKIENQPMYVIVGMSESEILKQYERIQWNYLLFGSLLTLLLLISSIIIIRMLKNSYELNQKLQVNFDKAQQANIAKTNFLATMSHEIRTPMNGILGISQILMKNKSAEVEQQKLIRTIYNSGKSLQSLLNDVLDMSKIEAGKMELTNTVFDPKQLAIEVATLFNENAQQKNLQVDVHWNGPKLHIYRADPIRIQQILSNLTNNAIKFSQKGLIKIEVSELNRNEKFANIEFSVTDSGIGISREDQEQLFKPFSQIRTSQLTPQNGTGLGLSIVRNLVELMAGKYGVESQIGQGSRFWVQIPVELISNDADIYSNEWSNNTNQLLENEKDLGGKVLVVEDNSTNRMVLNAILTNLGIEILEAEDGKKGVEAYRNNPRVNLILMDVQMPMMDGIMASKLIREIEHKYQLEATPIIAVTAFAYEEDRRNCLEVGMNDFLSKPIDIPALEKILQKYLHFKTQLTGNTSEGSLLNQDDLRRKIMFNHSDKTFDSEYMLTMLGWNKKLAKVIMTSAKQDIPNYFEKLTQSVQDDNWQEAKAITHTLKGILAQVGGVRIAKKVKEIDDAIRGGAKINSQLILELKSEYALLIVFLDQWVELN